MNRLPDERSNERGCQAGRPRDIPLKGWWDIALRLKSEMAHDNLSIISAGVAFYAFLAIFPALAALVSMYGLVTNPATLEQKIGTIENVLPADAAGVINAELRQIVEGDTRRHLGWGLVGGLVLALWSAAKGVSALFESLNIAYDEQEKRSYIHLSLLALLFTLGAILFFIVYLALIVGVPAALGTSGFRGTVGNLIAYLRWPLLAISEYRALAVLYRYGPSRTKPQWNWVSWGAIIATLLWLVGSFAFSFYVAHFGNYNKTYGSLGVVVVRIVWFLLSVYTILLGAEINAEIEHQTAIDPMIGKPKPIGQRGAYAADTLGPAARDKQDRHPRHA